MAVRLRSRMPSIINSSSSVAIIPHFHFECS
jgi:hypothetical protein